MSIGIAFFCILAGIVIGIVVGGRIVAKQFTSMMATPEFWSRFFAKIPSHVRGMILASATHAMVREGTLHQGVGIMSSVMNDHREESSS